MCFDKPLNRSDQPQPVVKLNEKQATIRNLDDDGLFGDKMGYGRTCRGYGCIVKKV